jgi:putative RecB family exonuclease
MRRCPRSFAARYVEQAPADFVPSSLILGSALHGALQAFYCGRLEGLTLSAEAMFLAYRQSWRQALADAGEPVPVRFNKNEDESTLDALAQRMIGAFLASSLASPKGTLVGIEETMSIVLRPDLPDLLAKVDLMVQTESSLFIADFKTSRSKWTEQKAAESAEQLLLYAQAAAPLARQLGLPIKLGFAVITKAKTPVVQVLTVPTDPPRLASLADTVAEVWAAIQAGNFYPNPSPQNCSTCPFKSRCPAFAGG